MREFTSTIRNFRNGDGPALRHIFETSVRGLAAEHYSSMQIEAWAPRTFDAIGWGKYMAALRPFVAEVGSNIAGYADLQADGYIDHCYVAAAYARHGVGSALIRHIVQIAQQRGLHSLHSNVSLTAERFFARHGFLAAPRREISANGVVFAQVPMRRALPQPA